MSLMSASSALSRYAQLHSAVGEWVHVWVVNGEGLRAQGCACHTGSVTCKPSRRLVGLRTWNAPI